MKTIYRFLCILFVLSMLLPGCTDVEPVESALGGTTQAPTQTTSPTVHETQPTDPEPTDPVLPEPVLVGIYLETLPKTEYMVGEWLDTSGGVILCEYSDGSTYRVDLTNSYVYGFEQVQSPGTYLLSVRYMDNGVIAETTYTITVVS